MSIQKMEIFGSDKSVSMSLQFQKVDKLIRQEEDNTGGIFNYIFLLVIYACTQGSLTHNLSFHLTLARGGDAS